VELIREADAVSAMRFVGHTSLPLNLLWGYAATSRVHVASPTRNQIRNARLIEENAQPEEGSRISAWPVLFAWRLPVLPFSCPLDEV